jgi:hypothetical protein
MRYIATLNIRFHFCCTDYSFCKVSKTGDLGVYSLVCDARWGWKLGSTQVQHQLLQKQVENSSSAVPDAESACFRSSACGRMEHQELV